MKLMRAGTQIGDVVQACSHRTPPATNSSKCGVRTSAWPDAPQNRAACWSAISTISMRKTNRSNVLGCGKQMIDLGDQARRQVLIEEQLHSRGIETNLRSRSAANCRQARMSAASRSGKS